MKLSPPAAAPHLLLGGGLKGVCVFMPEHRSEVFCLHEYQEVSEDCLCVCACAEEFICS